MRRPSPRRLVWAYGEDEPFADWSDRARTFHQDLLAGGAVGDSAHIWTWPQVRRDGSASRMLAAIALMPEGQDISRLQRRLPRRVDDGAETVWASLGAD